MNCAEWMCEWGNVAHARDNKFAENCQGTAIDDWQKKPLWKREPTSISSFINYSLRVSAEDITLIERAENKWDM